MFAVFFDDGSRRDLTDMLPTLLLEFLLRPPVLSAPAAEDQVPVMRMELEGGRWEDCMLVLRDSVSGDVEEVPGRSLPDLLASAVAMAIADATAPQT